MLPLCSQTSRACRYVDFGNVAQLSQNNKQVLIDAVVHAVNEDYKAMAGEAGGEERRDGVGQTLGRCGRVALSPAVHAVGEAVEGGRGSRLGRFQVGS